MKRKPCRTSTHQGKRKGNAKHNEHKQMEKPDVEIVNFVDSDKDFYASELEFYKKRYKDQLDEQNKKYIEKRNYNRCKSMDQFYSSRRYAPVEKILQYGNKDIPAEYKPDRETFGTMAETFIRRLNEWNNDHGNHLHILNAACHYDEVSIHAHIRWIWDYKDENGVIRCHQDKAMEMAGIEPPDADAIKKGLEEVQEWYDENKGNYESGTDEYKEFQKKYFAKKNEVTHKNNRSVVFTTMLRDMWNDICEEYGYPVIREAEDPPAKHEEVRTHKDRAKRELQAEEDQLENDKIAFEAYQEQKQLELEINEIVELEKLENYKADMLDEMKDQIAKSNYKAKLIIDGAERKAKEIVNTAHKKLGQKIVRTIDVKAKVIESAVKDTEGASVEDP